jgi:hypothetical protein
LRLLAAVPGEEHLELFRRVGFIPFTEETVLVYDGSAPLAPGGGSRANRSPGAAPAGAELVHANGAPAAAPAAAVRLVQPEDLWAVQRLYTALTPPLVQQAEGTRNCAADPGEETWLWPVENSLCACLRRQHSPRGCRLGLLVDPACRQHAPALLSHGLAGAPLPVYLVLRSYQGELLDVARRLGFRPYSEQVLLVKQLAVPEPLRQPVPARSTERALGTAPSTPSVGQAFAETKD